MRDTPSQTFAGRLLGAATLNRATYEADSGATGQAAAVVILAVAAARGSLTATVAAR